MLRVGAIKAEHFQATCDNSLRRSAAPEQHVWAPRPQNRGAAWGTQSYPPICELPGNIARAVPLSVDGHPAAITRCAHLAQSSLPEPRRDRPKVSGIPTLSCQANIRTHFR
jgi:hypothetical protein